MLDLAKERDAHIDERLRTNIIGWLITVRPDGRPHTVPVWFLWDGQSILVFSKPKNQKLVNIRNNPNVLLALDDTDEGEDVVIVEGTAEVLSPNETTLNIPAYLAKYGDLIKSFKWTPESMASDYSQPIRITPKRFP